MKHLTNDRPDSMHAEWVLSNVCNYTCNYCDPKLYGGSSGWPDLEKSLDFWQYIHTDVNPNAKMLTLSGGEPTIWPKLSEFFNRLDPSYKKAIVTNGSRTLRWWRRFIDNTPLTQIAISVHLEYADVDHIKEVIRIIGPHCRVTVLMMLDENSVTKGRHFAETLSNEDLYCKIVVKPITRRWNGINEACTYDNEVLDWIKTFDYDKNSPAVKDETRTTAVNILIDGEEKPVFYMYEMISKNMHKFRGWKCYAGTHRLVVWHDGNVYGAQCTTAKRNKLGNIANGKLDKKIEPLICDTEFCACVPDIRIPKEAV
jgi:organic radical activating enzyme